MRPLLRLSPAALCGALLLPAVFAPAAVGQDDLATQWTALVSRNDALAAKADALEEEFAGADPARRKEIEKEFQQVAGTFNNEILPEMQRVAPAVFAADPSNIKAGEFATKNAYSRAKFDEAERLAEALLQADPDNVDGLNLRGLAEYKQNKFSEAKESFAAATAAGVAGAEVTQWQGTLPELIPAWEREQQIRQAQADANLPRVAFTVAGPDGTEKGTIVVELFEEEAPNTVANMVSLVESGFYDGIRFHRVLPDFMAQVGDPITKDLNANPRTYGTGDPGYAIKSEFRAPDARKHFVGSLSMANSGPDTGGSQFFMTTAPTSYLNGRHTVFGRVVDGMNVLHGVTLANPGTPGYDIRGTDVIKKAEVLNKRPGTDYTVEKI